MADHELLLVIAALAPIPLGIAVLVAQHLISGPRDPLRDDPINLAISTAGWVLIAIGLVVPIVGLLGMLSVIGCIIGVFVLIEGYRKRRASQQNALLWLMVIAAERFMPLAPAIEAFARERGGLFGRRAKRLAELLAIGTPLPEALVLCPRMLPPYVMPMVRVGCQSGALAPALRQAATVHNQDAPLWMSLIGKISYLALLPILGFPVLVFVMIWIVPKFQAIFRDFNSSLPDMTQWLIRSAYFVVNYWYFFLPLIVLYGGLIVYAILRYFGLTHSDLPFLGRLTSRLDAANVLDALAVVARQQRPMVEGVAELARAYPKPKVRWRLARAAFDIDAGADWADTLCRRNLIRRTDLAVLQAAQRVGNLPWSMQETADSSRRRFLYRLQAIVQSVFPVAMIGIGAVVLFIVVALFVPLVELIKRMS
jgi:type II secretory pathway component PulF